MGRGGGEVKGGVDPDLLLELAVVKSARGETSISPQLKAQALEEARRQKWQPQYIRVIEYISLENFARQQAAGWTDACDAD